MESCSVKTKKWLRANLLLVLTFSSVVLGITLGLSLRILQPSEQAITLINYPGELFMRLLKLMILPLVIASLVTGCASLNAKMSGMIAVRTIVYFLTTSLLAAILGLILVVAIHPGNASLKSELGEGDTKDKKSGHILDTFLDLGRNLVPDNLFQATIQSAATLYDPALKDYSLQYRDSTNMLGIIFFCLLFGVTLGKMGPKAGGVVDLFAVVDDAVMKMVGAIMWISPIGITSVITAKILQVEDLSVVTAQLTWFLVTTCLGIFFFQFVILQVIYVIFVRKNPFRFWATMLQAWMTAFATASTATTLPVALKCLDRAGVDKRIGKFVMPIGATVNMDGTALFVTVASVFIAQLNNIHLTGADYVTIVLTSTAASVASASLPSAALVLMIIVLTAIDAPVQDVSLLWTVDWFVDRCRTTTNMLGDAYGAAVVEALSSKELRAADDDKEKEEEETKEDPDTPDDINDDTADDINVIVTK